MILLGFFWISVFNPVSSVMTAKYETIENTALRNKGNALSVSSGGLWIRENIDTGHSILHSRSISENGDILSSVTIFIFDHDDNFNSRIDAETAKLIPWYWKLEQPIFISRDGIPLKNENSMLPTQFTPNNIQDSFA